MKARATEFAWAAGLFDGEGSVSVACRAPDFTYARLQLVMDDKGSVTRFRRVVGLGNLGGPYGPYKHQAGKKRPAWSWNTQRREDVLLVLNRLWDWLGAEKRSAALRVLADTAS